MCSPVGHSIAALAIGVSRSRQLVSWQYMIFCIFSGNVADLDVVLGWALGDINKYHRLGSHSITAALIFGVLVYITIKVLAAVAIRDNRISQTGWAVSGALIYLSHCLLDLVSLDDAHPIGMQLLWPFSEQFYSVQFTMFRSFLHYTVGSDMWGMISGMFSWHNLVTVMHETAILIPVLLLAVWYRNTIRRNRKS